MSEKAEQIEQAPASTALLIVDMMNDLDFPGGETLGKAAERAARAIRSLRDAAEAADVPVVYVNDNYGHWRSDASEIVEHCAAKPAARAMVELLRPRPCDYFIVKPQFSGFYATNLPVLLPKLGVSRLILTGVATDICILFTAADAHMREYDLWVPEDAVAAQDGQRTAWALDIMATSMAAETRASDELPLAEWLSRAT